MKHDITSSDNVCWVNTEDGCIARFCKISGEIWPPGSNAMICRLNGTRLMSDNWDWFVAKVYEIHKIRINDKHFPKNLAPIDSAIW